MLPVAAARSTAAPAGGRPPNLAPVTPPLLQESGTYPASMQPLPFPVEAVRAAAEQCRTVATLVDEKVSTASTAAATAVGSWTGAYADDFGIAWPGTELSAAELVERLRTLAGQLDDAVDEAAAENERRAGLRAEWDCRARPGEPC
jgi:uncharacterized protein YukE